MKGERDSESLTMRQCGPFTSYSVGGRRAPASGGGCGAPAGGAGADAFLLRRLRAIGVGGLVKRCAFEASRMQGCQRGGAAVRLRG
jgi:hypothetical protein